MNYLFSNYDIIFINKDSGNVTFFSDEMDSLSIDINNINLGDVNFDEDDPENYYSCQTYGLV